MMTNDESLSHIDSTAHKKIVMVKGAVITASWAPGKVWSLPPTWLKVPSIGVRKESCKGWVLGFQPFPPPHPKQKLWCYFAGKKRNPSSEGKNNWTHPEKIYVRLRYHVPICITLVHSAISCCFEFFPQWIRLPDWTVPRWCPCSTLALPWVFVEKFGYYLQFLCS